MKSGERLRTIAPPDFEMIKSILFDFSKAKAAYNRADQAYRCEQSKKNAEEFDKAQALDSPAAKFGELARQEAVYEDMLRDTTRFAPITSPNSD